MPHNQSRRSKVVMTRDASEEEDISRSLKNGDGIDLITKAIEITNKNKKRRDAQRKVIVADHEQRVKATERRITTLFDDKNARVLKSQKELWKRLNDLNKRREVIEAQIIASMKAVELETNVIRHEINAVLEGRVQDIEERIDMRA